MKCLLQNENMTKHDIKYCKKGNVTFCRNVTWKSGQKRRRCFPCYDDLA